MWQRIARLIVLVCLLVANSAVAADWLYTVRPGDKLWTLAEKFCGTHTRWRDLAQHNQIPNPSYITPGSQIRFPLEWLIEEPAVVRVVYARGDVRVEKAGAGFEELSLGTELSIGARIVTGVHSYANVEFADGSTMQIGPESEVVFDTLSAYRDTGMVDSRVRIDRGAGSSKVEPQVGPGSVYRIATPLGVAAVRGTEFRTRSGSGASFVETVGGAVQFLAPTGNRDVNKGFGLKADASGVAVESLLEAPRLAALRPMGAHESLSWPALTGAVEYAVQVYAAADASQVLATARIPEPRYALADLQTGSYVFGVRGIAASGLQGIEATQVLDVQAALLTPAGITTRQPRYTKNLQVAWDSVDGAADYTVVATPQGGGAPVTRTTAATSLTLEDLPSDIWRVTVQANADDIRSEPSAEVTQRVARRDYWGLGGIFFLIALAL